MPRPRQNPAASLVTESLLAWADALGESLGRGMARGLSSGLSAAGLSGTPRKRGRPPKPAPLGPVPPERRCKIEGCPRQARSKGLCSAHYQAERRRQLAKAARS